MARTKASVLRDMRDHHRVVLHMLHRKVKKLPGPRGTVRRIDNPRIVRMIDMIGQVRDRLCWLYHGKPWLRGTCAPRTLGGWCRFVQRTTEGGRTRFVCVPIGKAN